MHHGEGGDRRLDLERIAAVVRAAEPDLAALQEVDRSAQRTGGVDQPSEYSRLTGMHGWFGAAMPFQGGEYGQVLLSRWPMKQPRVVRLPGTPGSEPRIALTALVDVPQTGRIRWAGLHLDAGREDLERWEQAGRLLEEFPEAPIPTLSAGITAPPKTMGIATLLEPSTRWVHGEGLGGAHRSRPIAAVADRLRAGITPEAWETIESKVIAESVASDHRPLLAVLRLLR